MALAGKTYKRKRSNMGVFKKKYTRAGPTARTGWAKPSSSVLKELQYADTTINGAFNTTGTIVLLNGTVPGSTATTRYGTKIKIKSISLKGYALSSSLTTVTKGTIHIVWDKNPNGLTFVMTDYLASATADSHPNLNNRNRFVTLCSMPFAFAGNNTTAAQQTSSSIQVAEKYLKVNLDTIYNAGTAGTIGDINQGGLFLVTIGTTAAGNADADLGGIVRIRFDA